MDDCDDVDVVGDDTEDLAGPRPPAPGDDGYVEPDPEATGPGDGDGGQGLLHSGYEPATECSGHASVGAKALMAWFLGVYADRGGRNLGIYLCRKIAGSTTLSLHSEGRACDFGVPTGAPWAQPLADTLVAWSAELGVQLVIYDRKVWSGRHPHAGWRAYTGSNPHRDHLHVEITRHSAVTLTAAAIRAVLTAPPAPLPAPAYPAWPGRYLRYEPGQPKTHGDDVSTWQNRMHERGWRIAVDGVYGPQSAAVALAFQREKGLVTDAVVGPKTWAAAWTAPVT